MGRPSIYEPLGLNAKAASCFGGDPDITTTCRLRKKKRERKKLEKNNPLLQACGRRLIADPFEIAAEIDISGISSSRNFLERYSRRNPLSEEARRNVFVRIFGGREVCP